MCRISVAALFQEYDNMVMDEKKQCVNTDCEEKRGESELTGGRSV